MGHKHSARRSDSTAEVKRQLQALLPAQDTRRPLPVPLPLPDPSLSQESPPQPHGGPDFLLTLADVELQLVMHGLECTDIVRLARCSRRLLHASDAPFGWTHSLLRVDSCNPLFRSIPLPRLLQHAPLSVRWIYDSSQEPAAAMINVLNSRARVHELDATLIWRVNDKQWMDALAHPAMQQLRVVHMTESLNVELMSLLGGLRLLHTLSLWSVYGAAALPWLSLCPSLTTLNVHDEPFQLPLQGGGGSRMISIEKCARLAAIVTRPAAERGCRFLSFFSSPFAAQLRSVRLDWVMASQSALIPAEVYESAILSLRSLHSLHLARWAGLNAFLPHLWCAPSLRHLTLQPNCHRPVTAGEDSIPHVPILLKILADAPALRCTVLLQPEPHQAISPVEWTNVLLIAKYICSSMETELHEAEPRFFIRSEYDVM